MAMLPASSNQLGIEVLKALGIECKWVLEFTLQFKANDLVTVDVKYAVPAETGLVEVLRKFRLQAPLVPDVSLPKA